MVNRQVNLRHTTGSFLSATGAYPKAAQAIMWHSDINLTLGIYTHRYREDEAAAVDKLPGLSHDPQRQRATGTADAHADDRDDSRLALCLAQKGGLQEAPRDHVRPQLPDDGADVNNDNKTRNADTTRACNQWEQQDSNLRPTDYESAALTAELCSRRVTYRANLCRIGTLL